MRIYQERLAILSGACAQYVRTWQVPMKALHKDACALKEVVAEQALELRMLKNSMIADGDDRA